MARTHGEKLSPALQQISSKVPGCVSVVRIAVSFEQSDSREGGGIVVAGEADARVARGMLALLAEGLRGVGVEQVMGLDVEEVIKIAKLQQFLPAGRNNGLANMLATIKQQAAAAAQPPPPAFAATAPAATDAEKATFSGTPEVIDVVGGEGVGILGQDMGTGVGGQDISADNAMSNVWAWGGRAEEVAMLLSGT